MPEKFLDTSVSITTETPIKITIENLTFKIIEIGTASGFFIKDGYIVTAGHVVLVEEFSFDSFSVRRDPPATAVMTRVARIFVHVFNVNGSDNNFIYQADLVGIDGAGDIAILKINHEKPWNQSLPKLDNHPYLNFSKSIKSQPGQNILVVGDPFGQDFHSVSHGVIRNNHYTDHSGLVVAESMLIDTAILSGNSGSPILENDKEVIGMVTWSEGIGFGGGPSQRFMQPVIKALIGADKKESQSHVQLLTDVFGNFWRYTKGYMGLNWNVVTVTDYIIPFDGPVNLNIIPKTKKIIGLRVNFVDGGTNGPFNSGIKSPFLGIILPGDIITHINKKPLGALDEQITPTLVTWLLNAGDEITLTYRKASEQYAKEYTVTRPLAEFPPIFDLSLFGIASNDKTYPTYKYLFESKKLTYNELIETVNKKAKIGNFTLSATKKHHSC